MVQENQTLKGRTVVVTRPRDQAEETMASIEERGGKPYFFPTIEISGPRDLSAVKAFFNALASKKVDYVILMSVNGVQHLFRVAESLGAKNEVKKHLKNTVTIAVGPKTAQELEKNGIRASLIPEKYTSEGILESLRQRRAKDKTIYIPRTNAAPPELAEKLRQMGNRVEEICIYRSQLPSNHGLAEKFIKDLTDEKIDAIIFTSSLGARNFFEMLRQIISEKKLRNLMKQKVVVVAIGPTTAKTLEEAGVKVDVMPEKHVLGETLDALARFWCSEKAAS
jgi:uroporphyrinogen-III synthase